MNTKNTKNEENISLLISCLKSMKQNIYKRSEIIFLLGAGFSNHTYGISLWKQLAESYLKKEHKIGKREINKMDLNSFETQLILDFAEDTINYYTEAITKYKAKEYLEFKKFYEQIINNSNILTKFITTNHCESINRYFSISDSFSFDIDDMNTNYFDNFEEIYLNEEVIINLHGSLTNGNKIVKTSEYHKFFMRGYNSIFSLIKKINQKNSNNIAKKIVLIFGSSLEEKHLISFLSETYKDENIFYVTHKKFKQEIYSIFEKRRFHYVSTCQSGGYQCKEIDECNDLFFKNIKTNIEKFFSPDPVIASNICNAYNKKIIEEITNIDDYIFGTTFKIIDIIIDDILKEEVVPYVLHENHFLTIFLWEQGSGKEKENIVNLYLYYYEKNNFDFWNIWEIHETNRGLKTYFNIFLKYIIGNDKFDLKIFLNNYMQLNGWQKEVFEVFNNFFISLKTLEKDSSQGIIFNFYKQIINYNSFDAKDIWFLKQMNEFGIEINIDEFLTEFKICKTENEYSDFVKKKTLVIFISKFFKLDRISDILITLFPEIENFKVMNSWKDSDFVKGENMVMYMRDYDFIKYVFIPYMNENNNISLPTFEELDLEEEFDLITTNFLLNYYMSFPKYSEKIENIFENIDYRKKIWKIKDFSHGIVLSYDATSVNQRIFEQLRERFEKSNLSEMFNDLIEEKGDGELIEYENENIKVMKEKLADILKSEDWKQQIRNITKSCFGLGTKILSKPWNDWKFFVSDFTRKYVEENDQISILDLDKFFTEYFHHDYLNAEINNVYKFDNIINLEMIDLDSLSKIQDVKSEYLFKQLMDLLNINSGNIYYIFRDTFNIKQKNKDNTKAAYIFEIWKKIFKHDKNSIELIDRIINGIAHIYGQTYKNNVKSVLENVFSNNCIPTWKKALYFYFDSHMDRSEFIKKESDWIFSDNEYEELNIYFETLSYSTKNANIVSVGNSSEILYIKYVYKRLFSDNCYRETNLLYWLVFSDEEMLIESRRYDLILFETHAIYKNFFDEDKKCFFDKITKKNMFHIWELFLNLKNYDLKIEDIDMLENIHNSLRNINNKKVLIARKKKKFIKNFISIELANNDNKKSDEECKIGKTLNKFQFCLLSVKKEDILKQIREEELTRKFWSSSEQEYNKKLDKMLDGLDDYICKH